MKTTAEHSASQAAFQFIETALRAKYPALWLVSHEEARVMGDLGEIAKEMGSEKGQPLRLFFWSIASGLRERVLDTGTYKEVEPDMLDPNAILDHAVSYSDGPAMFVLAEFCDFLDDVAVRRKFREVAESFKTAKKSLVILAPSRKVPESLDKLVTVVDIPLPGRAELEERIEKLESRLKGGKKVFSVGLTSQDRFALVNAGLGLTRHEFDIALSRCLVQTRTLDGRAVDIVAREKKQIVQKSGLMEFYEAEASMGDVGGLDLLKSWLGKRQKAFTDEARAFGLPEPKGILMVGIQGCGKSLTAKAAANMLRIPLLRLDMGALFGGLVGESESNARRAIQVAETLAPCILWIDEVEKSMSGMQSSGHTDGGTTARVFSTFLTWMAEKKKPVFVVATANDVTQLPPELLRKGRFDEIFAIDLPSADERDQILKIHIGKRKRNPEKFDLAKLITVTEGFSGAELEQLISDALFEAFDAGRDLNEVDLLKAAGSTVPLSKTMSEKIKALRQWAQNRARPASSYQLSAVAVQGAVQKDENGNGNGGSKDGGGIEDMDLFED